MRRSPNRPLPRIALVVALVALAVAFGSTGPLSAADPTPEKVFGWLSMRGDRVPVRYTPGSLDRAANVQKRIEAVTEALAKAGVKFDRITLYVAAPEEWQAAGCTREFGLPEVYGNTLLVPAWGTDRTVALWTQLVGVPPSGDGSMPIRGTPEEAGSLVWSDVLAQLDAARAGLTRAGVKASSPWILDLLAHLVALSTYERTEPQRLPEIDAFFATLLGRGGQVAGDTDERLAREARFYALARELALGRRNSAGEVAERIVDAGKKYGGLIPAGEVFARTRGAREAYERVFGAAPPLD
jgi:hypothetical protein